MPTLSGRLIAGDRPHGMIGVPVAAGKRAGSGDRRADRRTRNGHKARYFRTGLRALRARVSVTSTAAMLPPEAPFAFEAGRLQ
jgi:hypothetical protein